MSKFSAIFMLAAAMLPALGHAQLIYDCINQLIDGQPGLTVEAGHDKIFCDAVQDWSSKVNQQLQGRGELPGVGSFHDELNRQSVICKGRR